MRRLEDQAAHSTPTVTGRRLVPLAAATLIAPGVGIIQSLTEAERPSLVSVVASAVLFLLVMARMTGPVKSLRSSIDDEHRALFREGVLRQAAVALGGAPDRDAVEQVIIDAANALMTDAADLDAVVHLGPEARCGSSGQEEADDGDTVEGHVGGDAGPQSPSAHGQDGEDDAEGEQAGELHELEMRHAEDGRRPEDRPAGSESSGRSP